MTSGFTLTNQIKPNINKIKERVEARHINQ